MFLARMRRKGRTAGGRSLPKEEKERKKRLLWICDACVSVTCDVRVCV